MFNPEETSLIKKSRGFNDDNMTPLINIVFLLLIFFMIAGQIEASSTAKIELPEAQNSTQENEQKNKQDALKVFISSDNKMIVNNDEHDLESLGLHIQSLENSTELTLSIAADKALTADKLDEMFMHLESLGIKNIQLLVSNAQSVETGIESKKEAEKQGTSDDY